MTFVVLKRGGLTRPGMFVACAALLATCTLWAKGNSCGHDFNFHLLSWMEVARAWHTGIAYPHWVQDANYGAGEPRLIFYPPASWLLGAMLGKLGSWAAAPTLFTLVALLAAGGSMYLLAREWASSGAATFAACLYVVNPYAMFVAYERTAFGELLAAAWLPLMVWLALTRRGSVAGLALSIAGLWLTNSPAAVVGSYLLLLLAVGMAMAEGKAWPAIRAAGGMALGLGLAAFYIVPAAFEQRWVSINRAITTGMRVQDSFLFAHTADAFHDQILRTASWIVVGEFAVAALMAYVAWKKRAGGGARVALTITLPVILLLQLPVSQAIWKYTPHMRFLQFPWRWLLALSVAACALAAMALPRWRSRWPAMPAGVTLAGVMIAALAIGGSAVFFQPCDEEDAVAAQVAGFGQGQGSEGTDEYTPAGVDNASIQQELPLVRVLRAPHDDTADSTNGENPEWRAGDPGSLVATVHAQRPNGEHWLVRVDTPQTGYAVLRLLDYPAWRVTVDGKPVVRPGREDGLMAVPVTEGSHAIEVQWTVTRDVIAGREISCMALLGLALTAALERRHRRQRRV